MKVCLLIILTFLSCSVPIFAGESFEIKNSTKVMLNPCGAYNWKANQFMVAWEEHSTSTEWRIYVQRLFEDGTLNGNQISAIYGDGGYRRNPDIAYDPHSDRFLIVYVLNDTAIWGRFVKSNGTMSTLINIASGSYELDNPAVAYDPVLRQYLVTYESLGQYSPDMTYSQIFVQHVTSSGSKAGNPIRVSESANNATKPAIASVGAHSVVVWQEEDIDGTYDIGARVIRNGAIGSGSLSIAASGYTQLSPAIAADTRNGEYMIAWQARSTAYYRSKIYVMTLLGNSVRQASYSIASDSGYDLQYPSVGYDFTRNEFVVAWFAKEFNDGSPFGEEQIQFRRIGTTGAVTVDTAGGLFSGISKPFVTFNDSDTFFLGYQKFAGALSNAEYYIKGFIEEYCIDADINCDGDVDLLDLSIVSESWLVD